MRRKDYYWSLFSVDEKKQLDDLRSDQVEAIYAALAEKDHGRWLVWMEGFLSWKSFKEFPTLLQDLRKAGISAESPKAPSPPAKGGDEVEREREEEILKELEEEIEATGGPSLEVDGRSSTRNSGGRRDGARRYSGKFEVAIIGPQGRFRTRTTNASLNGLQIEDELPATIPRFFTLEMRGQDGDMIAMLCSAIRNPDGSPSTRLKIESNDHVNVLRSWLLKI